MKVLLCHNHYQQRGGEDQSFEDEGKLLESRGHTVLRFTMHNDAIEQMGRLRLTVRTIWHRDVHQRLRALIRAENPDVMHCTNTFPLISPAAYYAAGAEGVPVVQSLRNYRLLCANANLLRDGKICEECLTRRVAWPAVAHKCYRDSWAATVVVTLMVRGHRFLGTWAKAIDLYFTPSEFARRKYIEAGFSPDKIAVKPNFVFPDPGVNERGSDARDGCAVYVGRLSEEKGINVLLEAWCKHAPLMPLKIIGDGPMAPRVREAVSRCDRIQWLGRKPVNEALAHVGDASVMICPSIAYETFGRTVVETFAKGTPVVASDAGALAELVDVGRTGLLFRSGDAANLAVKVRAMASDPGRLAEMRVAARNEYLQKYNADVNHDMLIEIYRRAIVARRQRPESRGAARRRRESSGMVETIEAVHP